jgi:hypothetical protein
MDLHYLDVQVSGETREHFLHNKINRICLAVVWIMDGPFWCVCFVLLHYQFGEIRAATGALSQ